MPNLLSSSSWSDAPTTAYLDNLADNRRWSTWDSIERLCRGPEPWPDWLVTAAAAVDTDLGLLKSGKEADVSLLERAVPDDPTQSVVMAAKRYRSTDRRLFHRDTGYTEGRRIRNRTASTAHAVNAAARPLVPTRRVNGMAPPSARTCCMRCGFAVGAGPS